MQTVSVLLRINELQQIIDGNPCRKRELNDVSGAVGIIVEPLDGRANICLRGIGWQVFAD